MCTQSVPDGEDWSLGKYGLMNPLDVKYSELEDGGWIWVREKKALVLLTVEVE